MTLRPRRANVKSFAPSFLKSERIYFAAPPSQITTALRWVVIWDPPLRRFRFCRNIGF